MYWIKLALVLVLKMMMILNPQMTHLKMWSLIKKQIKDLVNLVLAYVEAEELAELFLSQLENLIIMSLIGYQIRHLEQ